MGALSVIVSGSTPPYSVNVREITETTGNRCNGCSGISNLTNLDVSYIADGQPHTYIIKVEKEGYHPGYTQTVVSCVCENIPTIVATVLCNGSIPTLNITPSITTGGNLRVIIRKSGIEVYNNIVTSGNTINFLADNQSSYSVFAEIPTLSSCRSNTIALDTNCAEDTCTLSVIATNPMC